MDVLSAQKLINDPERKYRAFFSDLKGPLLAVILATKVEKLPLKFNISVQVLTIRQGQKVFFSTFSKVFY